MTKIVLVTLLEFLAVIAVLVGFINEQKIINWEQEVFSLLKRFFQNCKHQGFTLGTVIKIVYYSLTQMPVSEIRYKLGIDHPDVNVEVIGPEDYYDIITPKSNISSLTKKEEVI